MFRNNNWVDFGFLFSLCVSPYSKHSSVFVPGDQALLKQPEAQESGLENGGLRRGGRRLVTEGVVAIREATKSQTSR